MLARGIELSAFSRRELGKDFATVFWGDRLGGLSQSTSPPCRSKVRNDEDGAPRW